MCAPVCSDFGPRHWSWLPRWTYCRGYVHKVRVGYSGQPIELRVNVSGIPSPSGSSPIGGSQAGLGSQFLDALADNARQAIEAARQKTSDAAQIPVVAAEEFVKGLSHEAGKNLAGFFSELIKAGFGSSTEKDNERQRFSMVIRQDLINYNRASPIPVIVDCPETKALERNTMLKQVLFKNNRWALADSADQVIDQVREFARTRPGSVLLLSGNTDTTGLIGLCATHGRMTANSNVGPRYKRGAYAER